MAQEPDQANSVTYSLHESCSSDSDYSYIGSDNSCNSDDDDPLPLAAAEIESAVDVARLDRALVLQAQLSGRLNSIARELTELEKAALSRVGELRQLGDRAKQAQRSLASDLPWLRRHVDQLLARARASKPVEFASAQDQIDPSAAL